MPGRSFIECAVECADTNALRMALYQATRDAEIAAIDKARGALTTERPAEALARVQTYRSTFAAPHFADEADAIEVQALAALGRKDEARRKGEEFLTRRPRSPYAQRVRSAAGLN